MFEEDYDYNPNWMDKMEVDFDCFIEDKFNARLLSNFDKCDLNKVVQCIIEFDLYNVLFVAKAYNFHKVKIDNHFGLYSKTGRNMTDFWQRFDELKGREN